jgi:hypothetical protein
MSRKIVQLEIENFNHQLLGEGKDDAFAYKIYPPVGRKRQS